MWEIDGRLRPPATVRQARRVSNRPSSPSRATSVRTPGFIGGVLGTAFAVALGFGLIVPALPEFATQLGAGFGATSAIISTFAAVRLVFSGPAGVLVDRTGARPIVAVGLLIVAVSSGVTALADSYLELLVLRGAGGVGSAMFITGIGQHIVRTVPSGERGRANGLLQGAFLLGGASGPAVGGLIIEALGIRAPFVIYAVTLLAATAATLAYLDSGSDVVAASGAGPAQAASPGSSGVLARFRFLARLGPVVRDRTFWAALGLYTAVAWASQGTRFVAVPLLGTEVLGAGSLTVGIALSASSVAHAVLLWPVSRIADGRGRRLPARVGVVIYVVSMLGLMTVTGAPGLIIWMLLQGAANGITSPIPAAIVGDLAPPGAEGRAVGAMNIARDLGSVFGPLATGFLADAFGFDVAFAVAAALLAVAFVGTLGMRETLER